jgi:hypothetical protein
MKKQCFNIKVDKTKAPKRGKSRMTRCTKPAEFCVSLDYGERGGVSKDFYVCAACLETLKAKPRLRVFNVRTVG